MSSPLYSQSRRDGLRFSAGHLGGTLLAALLVSVVLLPVHSLVQLATADARSVAFVVLAAVLAGLDAAGRTPFLWRQVPQRFYLQGMPVGRLGVLYGADMGLHVTTQKVTSLPWVVLAGSLLVGSWSQLVAVTAVLAGITSVILFGLAITEQHEFVDSTLRERKSVAWTTIARWTAAVLTISLAYTVATRVGSWS